MMMTMTEFYFEASNPYPSIKKLINKKKKKKKNPTMLMLFKPLHIMVFYLTYVVKLGHH